MKEGFKELYCSSFNRIKNFANIYLRDEESANNVAQDVFMQVYKSAEDLVYDETLLPYIFVLTKNRCLNILKKEKTKRRYRDDETFRLTSDLFSSSLEHNHLNNIDYKNLSHKYHIALDLLPEKTRAAFLMSREKEMRYKAIAEQQNVSIKTVEYRIMSALRIIRKELKDFIN